MNKFIHVKLLAGELKLTEIRRGVGYRLTTKEFILMREDTSYHIMLEDILGVILRDNEEEAEFAVQMGDTRFVHQFGTAAYKIVATKMRIYNRSGVIEQGPSTLFTQLSKDFSMRMEELLLAP